HPFFPLGLFQINVVTAGLANCDLHLPIKSRTVAVSSAAEGKEKESGRLTTIEFAPSDNSSSQAARRRIEESRNARIFHRESARRSWVAGSPSPYPRIWAKSSEK